MCRIRSSVDKPRPLIEIVAELKQKREQMENLEFTKAHITQIKKTYSSTEISKAKNVLSNLLDRTS